MVFQWIKKYFILYSKWHILMEKHGLIDYLDTKANCCHQKNLTFNWTSLHVFNRVHSLEIQTVIFGHSFVNCCPSPLLSDSTLPPPPVPYVNKYIDLQSRLQCVRGGMGFWASDR
jgi:hypothetical protein